MGIREELFPSTRHARLVQTEWCKDWFDTALGFGYVAEELTERRATFRASIDQAGIAIFFLQRHRVELTLKGWLASLGSSDFGSHNLVVLLGKVRKLVRTKHPEEWQHFDSTHGELVRAIAAVDEGSFTFRYPVTRDGTPVKRPDFIDLDVMQERVEAFFYAVVGWVDHEAELHSRGP